MEPPVVTVFLVGQRFQRRGVNRARVGFEASEDGVVRDDGLARTRWGGYEYALMSLKFLDRLDLEGIERPGQRSLKPVD
jgi:hypothetical protein